jgi:TRAP transporter 4TM/12TM fusion protein
MTGLTSTYLYTFIAFGCFLQILGIDKYYMDICLALAGKSRGGPAKVAVISSALVGTISGSSIANVTITGSLTIPMMKDTGFKPKDAAAIETAASTGGALMPPIMGAGIFVMSAMTGIPLITIIKVSVIPAILYYLSIYIFVEIKAAQYNLKGLSKDKIPSLWNSIKKSYFLFIPLIILIFLLVFGYTPFLVSASCTLLIVVFSYLSKELRIDFKKFLQAMRFSCENMMTITAVSACAAIIMGALTLTGLILKMTSILIIASNGILPILIFLLAFLAYVLGMGLPVTLSYILVAMLGAPALVQSGVSLLAAHLFVFWISQVATISPPVCMTAFVAAEIAHEKDYMKVGFTSLNVAKAIYLIPLFFIYTSILEGNIFVQLRIFLQAALLIIIINIFSEGYLMGFLKNWERALMGLLVILQCYSIFSNNIFNQIIFTILGLLALIWIAYNQYKIKFKEK